MCEFDVCGIAETHMTGDNVPYIEGYAVFAHNRQNVHKRAKCGSGGVCLLVKQSLLMSYDVSILDKSFEDILWVKLVNKISKKHISICVCYLSPEGSSRMVDPHEYFEQLLSQIYIYQTYGSFIICGDFNARCGGEADYIDV